MFPFMKFGYQKDSSIFNWTEKQTCFIQETFSDDALEKLYFMEEQRSLFLECNIFWRYNNSKDQSWSSVFMKRKGALMTTFYYAKLKRISFEGLFSLKGKVLVSSKSQKDQSWSSIFIEEKNETVSWTTPFYHAKIRSINFEALFSLKRKRVRFLNETFLPTHKSKKWVLKLPFHWREKGLFREWEIFHHATVRRINLEAVF